MISPEQRYLSDPHFKVLVDTMVAYIQEAKFTPSELREAAIFAAIIYETRFSTPVDLQGECFLCRKPIGEGAWASVTYKFSPFGVTKKLICDECAPKVRATLEEGV